MSESERRDLSQLGFNTDENHGREPGQTDLGPHPATNLVGLIQDHDKPQELTVHERGVNRDKIRTQWLTANIEDTVSLEAQR